MKFSIVIPIRRRTISLRHCLHSLYAHSRFQHEVILVRDRAQSNVVEWTEKNARWLEDHSTKVLTSPYTDFSTEDQFGTANASNFGWKNAKNDWLMCMDDDMYVADDWDYNLIQRINREEIVYVPVNVVPEVAVKQPTVWGEWYHLTYPKELMHAVPDKRFGHNFYTCESEWNSWANKTKVDGIYFESCGTRKLGHWMPIVVHRDVFELTGGFPPGIGRDIHFDDLLRDYDYMKVVVRDSFFLHSRQFFKLDLTAPNLPYWSDEIGP